MEEPKFERFPQNDLAGLKLVNEDYDYLPAKGLIHGLQKDAIQNSVGAAKDDYSTESKDAKSLKNWGVNFELTEINGKDSLIFWDT